MSPTKWDLIWFNQDEWKWFHLVWVPLMYVDQVSADHRQQWTNVGTSFFPLQGSNQLWWWWATNCIIAAANATAVVWCLVPHLITGHGRSLSDWGGDQEEVWSPATHCYCCSCSRRKKKVGVREFQVWDDTQWLWCSCLSTGAAAERERQTRWRSPCLIIVDRFDKQGQGFSQGHWPCP